MHIRLFAIAGVLALVAASGARAQQTAPGQDDQSGQARQTTSADWATSTATKPPEQAGDLYQGNGRGSGTAGASAGQDSGILPGALTPGADPLGTSGHADRKD